MTGTTEMDLKEVVRDLFEQIVREINADHGDLASFAELVEEEEEIYLWFGGETPGGEAKYTARASFESEERRIDFSLHTAEGFAAVFFKLALEEPLAGRRLTIEDLGHASRDAVRAFFEELTRRVSTDKFVYEVRKSFL